MKQIDEKTVEFNDAEQEVKDVFDLMLDEGIDTTTAAKYACLAAPKVQKPFVEYLSEGTLTKVKGKIVAVNTAA